MSCQLSSRYATDAIVKSILPDAIYDLFLHSRTQLESLHAQGYPVPECTTSQKEWSGPVFERALNDLLDGSTSVQDRARLQAVSAEGSSAWLLALPAVATGTLLDDESLRIAVGLRLGSRVVGDHVCTCGVRVELSGSHGLSCRRSAGRGPRHAALNELLSRTLRKANVPSVLEPPGLSRADGKRPDGLTLVPFEMGRPLVWDAVVTDTLAPSYVSHCAQIPGYAANQAEVNKVAKYRDLREDYSFSPFAFETLGPPGGKTKAFIKDVCKRLKATTGSDLPGLYFKQQISLIIQRGNVASVLGTISPSQAAHSGIL